MINSQRGNGCRAACSPGSLYGRRNKKSCGDRTGVMCVKRTEHCIYALCKRSHSLFIKYGVEARMGSAWKNIG